MRKHINEEIVSLLAYYVEHILAYYVEHILAYSVHEWHFRSKRRCRSGHGLSLVLSEEPPCLETLFDASNRKSKRKY